MQTDYESNLKLIVIRIIDWHAVLQVKQDAVIVKKKSGEVVTIPTAMVIWATGMYVHESVRAVDRLCRRHQAAPGN